MATHDYVIDNASGSAVRTDLNNVFQAILTNNSSGSAPSTTAACAACSSEATEEPLDPELGAGLPTTLESAVDPVPAAEDKDCLFAGGASRVRAALRRTSSALISSPGWVRSSLEASRKRSSKEDPLGRSS